MYGMMRKIIRVLAATSLLLINAAAFLPSHRRSLVIQPHGSSTHRNTFQPAPTTQVLLEKKNQYDDGTGAGNIIFACVLAICVWLFTIPPDFRRAYFCPDSIYCREDQSLCENCVTWNEWFNAIRDYYKGGGGIQWDFSIDPKTLEKNQEFLDLVLPKDKIQ